MKNKSVALMSALIINPKILVLDEAFTYISKSCSKKNTKYIKKNKYYYNKCYSRCRRITII